MNNAKRQRVIVHTEPKLIGAAVGAWLEGRSDLEVLIDPNGSSLAEAGEGDVIVTSTAITSPAAVVVIDSDGLSIPGSGDLAQPYRDLEQLYSVIKQMRRPGMSGSAPRRSREGGSP